MRIWGDYWEDVALKFLNQKNLKTVKKNYNCKAGEIDIIMIDGNMLVFVEVKYRKNSDWVSAIESITINKQKRIIRAAQLFLLQNKKFQDWDCRFDVVAIQGDKQKPEIQWLESAFETMG